MKKNFSLLVLIICCSLSSIRLISASESEEVFNLLIKKMDNISDFRQQLWELRTKLDKKQKNALLIKAIQGDHYWVTEKLIVEQEVDVNYRDENNKIPLDYALERGPDYDSIVELLLKNNTKLSDTHKNNKHIQQIQATIRKEKIQETLMCYFVGVPLFTCMACFYLGETLINNINKYKKYLLPAFVLGSALLLWRTYNHTKPLTLIPSARLLPTTSPSVNTTAPTLRGLIPTSTVRPLIV